MILNLLQLDKGENGVKDLIKAFNEVAGGRVFPLQTTQSMAERWGVSKHIVNHWAMERDFPTPVHGVVEKTSMTSRLYSLVDVERYEKLKGLK
jgi:hypothetical protein